ncbi:MAG: glycosyltransferase family 4 protein [Candidatus Altiarchaeota archaeon]
MKKKIVVSSFPAPIEENPYQKLLYESLKEFGVELLAENIFSLGKLWSKRKKVDIIHFHWIFFQVDTLVGFLKFMIKLIFAKLLGYRIIWTAHNIESHEQKLTDTWGKYFLIHLSDAIITHGKDPSDILKSRFRVHEKIHVIPHGNYIGYYPNKVVRKEAREQLGIAEGEFVYLYLGLIREYKGVLNLIESFKKVGDDSTLYIVGKPFTEEMRNTIERSSKDNEKIRLNLNYVPDEDIQYYFNAADVAVLPFTKVTTSGTLILAMSFGKPVISARKGVLPEIVGLEIGILIDRPEELTKALKDIRQKNLKKMGENAYKKAEGFDWKNIAKKHRKIYEEITR